MVHELLELTEHNPEVITHTEVVYPLLTQGTTSFLAHQAEKLIDHSCFLFFCFLHSTLRKCPTWFGEAERALGSNLGLHLISANYEAHQFRQII